MMKQIHLKNTEIQLIRHTENYCYPGLVFFSKGWLIKWVLGLVWFKQGPTSYQSIH